jgi:choloylglycine hydrolase
MIMAKQFISSLVAAMAVCLPTVQSTACTRVVYHGQDSMIVTARSMDWKADTKTNLWIFPRGLHRDGATGPNTVKWISKYGSVVASFADMGSPDGMNEKGLVANMLWLVESEYPRTDTDKPGISLGIWAQYVLDNFATVDEAVHFLEKESFAVYSAKMPGTNLTAAMHLSLSDASGDNAILEYVKGKLVIYHDPSYQVMTNSPVFDKQLALAEYWKEIGGTTMLPGTNRASDRFARAAFYINAVPKTADARIAVAAAFSVIRNCSVPFGISTPSMPNISSTRWRSVSDQKNKIYYFENVLSPSVFWVDLNSIDFSGKIKTQKLSLINDETYAGDVTKKFKVAEPFKFAGL